MGSHLKDRSFVVLVRHLDLILKHFRVIIVSAPLKICYAIESACSSVLATTQEHPSLFANSRKLFSKRVHNSLHHHIVTSESLLDT